MDTKKSMESETAVPQMSKEEEHEKPKDQHYRLGGQPPLQTILNLSFGPILSQVSSALFGIVDTMWVGRALGTKGIAAISTYSPFDNIGRSFGFFLCVSGSSKISALFGQGKGEDASQVMCDILRVALICAIIIPAILLPFVKMAAKAFGASDEIADLGYGYITVTLSCSFANCMFLSVGGFLQGEGRTLIFGITNLFSCLLNGALLDPVFLFYTNMGIKGAATATVLVDCTSAIILLVPYFCGCFSIKPKFSQFFKCFSPNTLPALKVGLSALIAQLSMCIPGIVIQYYIGNSTRDQKEYEGALGGNTVTFRYAMISMCVIIAINNGYLPPAAYAFAAKKYKRWIRLTIHQCWINFAWGIFITIMVLSIPRQISMIFTDDENFLNWAEKMVKAGNCAQIISWIKNNAQAILQSLQMGTTATILSFCTQLVSLIIFATILYFTDRYNPVRIQYAYPLAFLFGLIVSIFVLIKPIKKIIVQAYYSNGEDDESDFNLRALPEL